ncbi:MAG: cysteine hydrolase family protein [Nitrososphaerales archaeon]
MVRRMRQEKLSSNAALVIIDVQKTWDDPRLKATRNNPNAELRMAKLLAEWRRTGRPVFHVRHDSRFPNSLFRRGRPGNEIKGEVKPRAGEPVISKSVNSAFIGTDLEARLRRAEINEVVITGITTDHCVSTTARMAGNLGFKTFVVSDATAAHDWVGIHGERYNARLIHETSLASLNGEFAEVLDSKELLKRL